MKANTTDKQHRNGQRRHAMLSIDDPLPIAAAPQMWSMAAQAAVIGLFVVVFIAALSLARPLLLPAASAFVVTMMLGPISARAERAGIPIIATAIVLWLLVIAVSYGLIVLLASPVVDWIGKAPEIGRTIREKLHVFDGPLNAVQDLRNALLPAGNKESVGVDIANFVQPVLAIVAPGIGQVFIFYGTLFFMLLGRNRLRRDLVGFFERREAKLRTLKIMNDIETNLTDYLSLMTVINTVVGIGAGVIAWLTGMPDPVAWGVLGFILNYIPYIGALMMQVALFLVGLVTFPTLGHALIAPLLYLGFTTLEGHFVTPSVVGHRLTLNPLTVFLSLLFWTWLWGPVGAFLAVPLLIMGLAALAHLFPSDEPALPD
jgi:predicted PurR-regulated permease PerM